MPEHPVSDPLLSVRDLRVDFSLLGRPARAVDGVSFDLAPGEVLGVVGESGSGKSVTALAMMRLLPQPPARVAGEVRFQGRDLLKIPEREMQGVRGGQIAMVFQDPLSSLNPVMTVGYQVAEAIALHQRVPMKVARERAVEMLDRVRIPDAESRAHAYPHQLSGGQRQRLMVARALLLRPRLLVADEPVSMVDASLRATILANIVTLNSAHGIAIVYITHDITTAYHVADEVLVLHRGHVVERGDAAGVIGNPRHDYTRLLVSSIPWPDLDRRWGDGQDPRLGDGESAAERRAATETQGTTP